jgi:hypothetical protein
MVSNPFFVAKLMGLGVMAGDIQLLDEEMDADMKERILGVKTIREYREILAEWNRERKAEGKEYLHD